MSKLKAVKTYLWILGGVTAFWWPLSHWFYPDWYHNLLGFENYDYSLVKIIGTIGIIPVLGIFFTALNPIRNRDLVVILLVFSILMAATYIYLIRLHNFPKKEYINVFFLMFNVVMLSILYPWKEAKSVIK